MALDQGGAVPLAKQIRTDLLRRIVAGQYALGEKIPSLRALGNRLGVSVTTVNQAYLELERRGVVEARPKSGFFVRERPSRSPVPGPPASRPSRPRPSTAGR